MGNNESVGDVHGEDGASSSKKHHRKHKEKTPIIDIAVLEAFPDKQWTESHISRLISSHKLAPLTLGADEPATDHDEECPICFMNFSYGLNLTLCCNHPICTKCLLAIQPHPFKSSAEDVKCPFCNNATLKTKFTGPQSKEAIIANRDKEKQAEDQRMNAERGCASMRSTVNFTVDEKRLQQEHLKDVQRKQQERFEQEKSRANGADSLIYVVDGSSSSSSSVPKVSLDDILGDGFHPDMAVPVAVQLLKLLNVADDHDDVDTVLAKGKEFAQKLEDVCNFVDLIREDDVRHACSVYRDPAENKDKPKEAILCAQLIDELARE